MSSSVVNRASLVRNGGHACDLPYPLGVSTPEAAARRRLSHRAATARHRRTTAGQGGTKGSVRRWLGGASVLLAGIVVTVTVVAASGPHRRGLVEMTINGALDRHQISPYIYGLNNDADDPGFAAAQASARPTMNRIGGDDFETYNWKLGDYNAGCDYYDDNLHLGASKAPGAYYLDTIHADEHLGGVVPGASIASVPIMGHVAANADNLAVLPQPTTRPQDDKVVCAGQSASYEAASYDASAAVTPVHPTSTTLYQDAFVRYLRTHAVGADVFFELDNEPDLYEAYEHPDVHPRPVTYAELLHNDLTYAAMIKANWPGVQVLGPDLSGWDGIINLQDAPDAAADGTFVPWWLREVHAADVAAGHTLINVLDVHWYPQQLLDNRQMTASTLGAFDPIREQAPRSLWDPQYVEHSWITKGSNRPIELLPTLWEWINHDNPGMGLAVTEWNYGGGGDISGAIATADALGIFGKYGVEMAAHWPNAASAGGDRFTYAGFDAFRDFDGHGDAFGSISLDAVTSNVATTSIYASASPGDPGRTTVVLINKATVATRVALGLTHVGSATTAHRFVLTAGSPKFHGANALVTRRPGHFTLTMPAQSVTVLVIA